jgi:hypothetical protein
MAFAQTDSIWKEKAGFDILPNDLFLGNNQSNLLEMNGSSRLTTSHLNMKFIRNFYNGGRLADNIINTNSDNLDRRNRFGFENDYSVNWMTFRDAKIDSTKKVHFSTGYKSLFTGQYGKDAFLLFMKGNAAFAGKSANLSHIGLRSMEWIYLGAGTVKLNVGKNNKTIFSLNGQLVLSGNNFFLNTWGKTGIYTDTFGRFLNVDATGSWTASQNRPSGLGATFSLRYASMISKQVSFNIGFEDAGPVMPFKNSKGNSFDTSFVFEGFYLYNLNKISDPDYWESKTDSLITPLTTDDGKQILGLMPARIFGSLTLMQSEKSYWSLAVSYRFGVFAIPLIQVSNQFLLKPSFLVQSSIGYGGWGALQWEERFIIQKGRWAGQLSLQGIHTLLIKKLPGQVGLQCGVSRRL